LVGFDVTETVNEKVFSKFMSNAVAAFKAIA
jgi:hypothetical protein